MNDALNTWSTAGSWLRYSNAGSTTDDDGDYGTGRNYTNAVHFGTFGGSSPPLGQCQTYMEGYPTLYIVEMDIKFNAAEYWSAGDPVTANDFETTALHESGHGFGLSDVYGIADLGEVMYGVSLTGSSLRAISAHDRQGIIYIYGSDGSAGIAESEISRSQNIALSPNPIRNFANIALPSFLSGRVKISVLDILGRTVAVPFDGEILSAQNPIRWNVPDNLGEGVYLLRVDAGSKVFTGKTMIIR
jgi:hypothetical protein